MKNTDYNTYDENGNPTRDDRLLTHSTDVT